MRLNRWLCEYRSSGHSAVQLLASNDVHYVDKGDADAHDTLLCIQTSSLKSEQNRMRMLPAQQLLSKIRPGNARRLRRFAFRVD